MNKKFIVLVCVLISVFAFSAGIFAAEPTPWDGTVDTSWYSTDKTSFEINDAKQLAGLAAITNNKASGITMDNFAGKTITLTADLDLGGVQNADGSWDAEKSKNWIPIGMNTNDFKNPDYSAFAGTFDGNGYKIRNMYLHLSGTYKGNYTGLFSYAKETSKLMHITIESGHATVLGHSGAIVGYSKGIILDCSNHADILGSRANCGGIVGTAGAESVIYRCVNTGSLSCAADNTANHFGGIVGNPTAGCAVVSCRNTGDMNMEASTQTSGLYCGGIAGAGDGVSIRGSYHAGNLTGVSGKKNVGAITGSSNAATALKNCYYLKSESINAGLYGSGSDTNAEVAGAKGQNDGELKNIAPDLGADFVASAQGYPLLKWESTGTYEADEAKSAAVSAVELTNGTIKVTLDKAFVYTKPVLGDFKISFKQKIGEASAAYTVKCTNISAGLSEDGKNTVVTIDFPAIPGTYADAQYLCGVSFKEGAAKESNSIKIAVSDHWQDYAAEGFAGGTGTYADPYQIATAEQLAYLAHEVNVTQNKFANKYFVLTDDIDLKKAAVNQRELLWDPIGYQINDRSYKSFNGSIDGKNHVIKNMKVSPENDSAGLFGYVYSGRIHNIKLEQVQVSGDHSNVGALAGTAVASEIRNCHILSGSVQGNLYVGGLVGVFFGDRDVTLPYTIANSSSSAKVSGVVAGGLAGRFSYSSSNNPSKPADYGNVVMTNCYADGDVTGLPATDEKGTVGGLIGTTMIGNYITVNHCYAAGNITAAAGTTRMGGLIGDPGLDGVYFTPKNLVVTDNVVLSAVLSGLADSGVYCRVVGLGDKSESAAVGTFKNNLVVDSMTLGGKAFAGESGDNVQGTTCEAAKLQEKATWSDRGFDLSETSVWTWNEAKNRPVSSGAAVPYAIVVTEQPCDATAYNDRAADFYVASKLGVGSHTYLWQKSVDGGKTWMDLPLATDKHLSLTAGLRYDNSLIRCQITDEAGTVTYSDSARLTISDSDFTPGVIAKNLYEKFAASEITDMKVPAAMAAFQSDLSQCNINVSFYEQYNSSELSNTLGKGLYGWAAIDAIAQGENPTIYKKTGAGIANPETTNLISEYLEMQSYTGDGSFYNGKENDTYNCAMTNINYAMAIDMYFNGASTWGNENEEGTTGKVAAFRYFIGKLVDDRPSRTDGRYFVNFNKLGSMNNQKMALRYNAEYVILMARFAQDPALEKQAKAAMYDVLTVLAYQYDNQRYLKQYTETSARYISALVAAAEVTESETRRDAYLEKAKTVSQNILKAVALDGTFADMTTVSKPPATGDVQATAAVLMAFSDLSKESCFLGNVGYTADPLEVIAADLNEINLPAAALSDIALPASGSLGTVFSWSSDHPEVIGADGTVSRPQRDTVVTLTVTATYQGSTLTHDYKITVTAQRGEGGDEVFADLAGLKINPEAIYDLSLPTAGVNGSAVAWASSAPEVISAEGKVVRPAIGEKDAEVTLTATVTKGNVTETKDFMVKVWANVDTSTNAGKVAEAYYQSRWIYMNKTVLNGYWDVWAAYAALGEDIANFDYIYDDSGNSASQLGASILSIIALGENPYNYKGVNYVEKLRESGLGGAWSVPVYNALGAEAAGMNNIDLMPALNGAANWLTSLSYGPDIGGWACVPISRHLDVAAFKEKTTYFLQSVAKDMAGQTTGSGSLSMGCVSTGLAALYAGNAQIDGIDSLNVVEDEPWSASDPIGSMYTGMEAMFGKDSTTFGTQLIMEFCDMYNVYYDNRNVGWLECGVTKAKLDAQMEKANAILAEETKYEAASIKDIKAAMEKVNAISEERLNNKIADYGEEYYTLYDAVRYAKLAGQSEMDQAVADKVADQINALNDEITLADKEAVEAAKAAYDALTNDQKALVAEEVKAKLTAAVDTIAGLEQAEADKEAAANVINEINKINENVTLDDQSAVAAARAAYDALTKEQKALVTNLDKLTKAEGVIKELLEKDNGKVKNMTDVTGTDWFYNDVAYVLDNNIFKGTSDTTFSPNQAMTRAMFVTVLGRNAGVGDSSASYPSTSVFDDVANDAYYASHVKWAVENGITVGVSKTEFAPNAQISRQDMATMMLRYAKAMGIRLPEMSKEAFGDDADIAVYAKEAVYKLKAVEIINGKDGNIFDPKGSTTRAEVAAVLHRFLTYKYEDFVKVDDTDCVIVDIEKFTLGQGFIMEPVVVKVEAGDTAADVTLRAAEQVGVELQYRDSEYGFYLSAVRDDETREANIPQYILDAMEKAGAVLIGRESQTWLSEKDYNSAQGGWIYWVNHEHMGVGAGNADVKAGDVIRWQFSVYGMGLDLGAKIKNQDPYVTVGEKDALIHAMAVASNHEKAGQAYENAVKVMEKMDATQAEINAATEALQ